jgi:hypothetical protein
MQRQQKSNRDGMNGLQKRSFIFLRCMKIIERLPKSFKDITKLQTKISQRLLKIFVRLKKIFVRCEPKDLDRCWKSYTDNARNSLQKSSADCDKSSYID